MNVNLFSLVVWDDIKKAFIPCNTIPGIPLFEKADCLEICDQLIYSFAAKD